MVKKKSIIVLNKQDPHLFWIPPTTPPTLSLCKLQTPRFKCQQHRCVRDKTHCVIWQPTEISYTEEMRVGMGWGRGEEAAGVSGAVRSQGSGDPWGRRTRKKGWAHSPERQRKSTTLQAPDSTFPNFRNQSVLSWGLYSVTSKRENCVLSP